ncbi:hypothetical protein [Edaphobacter sp. 12200R-103]|jgi:hypothetical protein|uniref:hypothetical protein n=1 Tax=Edaphobacter sp. 12200R-103 TaxID=2703788 RepID=UPI00138C091D|nr:hypothetical protein [Edaphobacter sp. 12200R-103]QHS51959.1 hypothetical protein GWR55_09550 [Edaphobacter sp. 12200R-103]
MDARLRRSIFKVGVYAFVTNLMFYGLWQQLSSRFTPCHGKAVGVEVGLAFALITVVLALFGKGMGRWLLAAAGLVASYFWFSWITWIGQMQC